VRKHELVSEVAETLNQASFNISRVIPYGSYCFDIAARRDILLILKVLVNVDSMDADQAEQLKRLSRLVSGYPLLIGDRTRTERIEDDVVHERYSLPAINAETLKMILQNAALPLIYGTKGGYYVEIDGDALRAERMRRELSLGQLAELAGVSRESIYAYEHGGSATVETAMALVDILGANLVRPVEILRDVQVDLRPDLNIKKDLLKFVAERLRMLGFGVYRTRRTPFDVMATETEGRLLTAVFEHHRNLAQHAEVISSLSQVVDITAFMVSHEKETLESMDGVAIIGDDELGEIDKRSDLSGIIREKEKA
jgi:putative transcriptional regulator